MAENWRQIVKTRSVYYADDLMDVGIDKQVLVCLPLWAWYVARSFLVDYGARKTSYSTDYRVGLYRLPDDAEFDIISERISSAIGGDIMCVQELVEAIEGISLSIQQSSEAGCDGCGTGSGGSGGTQPPPSSYEDDGVNPPAGNYDDYDAYKATKCSIAGDIIDKILKDLQWIIAADIVSLTATAMAIALITPIPFDDLLAFAGFLVGLFLQGVIVATANAVSVAITANRQALVCDVYEAANENDAEANFEATLGLSGINGTMASYFITPSSFNSMFEFSAPGTGTDDCSSCDDDFCAVTVLTGSEAGGVYSSADIGYAHLISVFLNTSTTDPCGDESQCGPPTLFWIKNLTGWVPYLSDSFKVYNWVDYPNDCATATVWSSNVDPSGSVVGIYLQFFSSSPYTMELSSIP